MKYTIASIATTYASLYAAAAALAPQLVHAQSFNNPLSSGSVTAFLNQVLGLLIDIGTPIVILAVIWTGFLFVRAQGNVEELKKAKTAFFWTLIGALILLGAFALSALIAGTVNQIR